MAAADNGVIGRDNGLPWNLPEDLRYFKRVTMGKPIVMGRRTFESIGRPLPGRSNIVISRNVDFLSPGVQVVTSLDEALALADNIARIAGASEIIVIGGAEVYRLAMSRADRLYITEVHAEVEGDVKLPPVHWPDWRELSREYHAASAGNPFDYSFVVYDRVAS